MSSEAAALLAGRLERAWSAETSTLWEASNPARGQCSVTALAVQRRLGGEILKTQTPSGPHFYNRIAGRRYDFTAGQFAAPIPYDDVLSSPEEAMSDTSPAQLAALERALGSADPVSTAAPMPSPQSSSSS